jgi:hypothetical protein
MPTISETHVAVRFYGDDLDPDELSKRLGVSPSSLARKGEVTRSASGRDRTAKTGRWVFRVESREPGDLDGQIRELFGCLTPDLATWHELAGKYAPDLFVGLMMKDTNEGIEVSVESLAMLAERRVTLSLDLYGPLDESDDDRVDK